MTNDIEVYIESAFTASSGDHSDSGYDRQGARVVLDRLLHEGRPSVVCTQGELVPDLLRGMLQRLGPSVPQRLALREGTFWVLHVAADAAHSPPSSATPYVDSGGQYLGDVTRWDDPCMATHRVSRSVVIDAPVADIFDIIAAPHRHPEFDGSGWVRDQIEGPRRMSLDARFGMRMRAGLPYRMTNRVVEFEEGRLLAWRHLGAHRWRWELSPIAGGTRVTETFDYSYALSPLYQLVGWPARNARNIERTLARLKALIEDHG